MTPEEIEAHVIDAVAWNRLDRWGYRTTLGGDAAVRSWIEHQRTDFNLVSDVRTVLAVLLEQKLIVTPEKERVLAAADEWRDASEFVGDIPIGERLTRFDEACPALKEAVDALRATEGTAQDHDESDEAS